MIDDARYFLDRSSNEAVRAIQASQPIVAGIHQELCLLYTIRALTALRLHARTGR